MHNKLDLANGNPLPNIYDLFTAATAMQS